MDFPKTVKEYFEDSYRFESKDNRVLKVDDAPDAKEQGQKMVILEKTIFHPSGGGQPSDTGFMVQNDIKFTVDALAIKDDVILHIGKFEPSSATFDEGSPVDCYVDEASRRLHARIHSAGHLLDVAMNLAGRSDLKPGKGYHHQTGAYVEYIGGVDAGDKDALV